MCTVSEGEQCPCGAWVTPAFHVQKAKVDVCRSLAVAMGMSVPKSATVTATMSTSCKHSVNCDTPAVTLRTISSPDGLSE